MTCVCGLFPKLEMVIPLSSHFPSGTKLKKKERKKRENVAMRFRGGSLSSELPIFHIEG